MLTLAPPDAVWMPVDVSLPDETGRRRTHRFHVRLRRVGRAEFRSIADRLTTGELDDDGLLHEVVLDWRDVQDADGGALAFSRDALDRLIDIPEVVPALIQAWFAAHSGEGARKN
ncbi:MAG: hypothetical protein KatS3mg119_1884 [Rhodothalassiaceae bacterium]|nr:MAG: hypothetical protein KatS3mg119_1884 [Rhodothalassiaceae bacterium]